MKPTSRYLSVYFFLSAFAWFLMPSLVKAGDDEKSTTHKIELSFFTEDSVNKVKAVITSIGDAEAGKPFKGAEVKFFAKKSFGLLPIGEDAATTDENGVATVDFPTDLPGDSLGNIQVIAKVEDNDETGNLEEMKTVKWGIPKYVDFEFHKRALWASGANAPIPLVITVTSMVIGVWGVIFYIIRQLFKIPVS